MWCLAVPQLGLQSDVVEDFVRTTQKNCNLLPCQFGSWGPLVGPDLPNIELYPNLKKPSQAPQANMFQHDFFFWTTLVFAGVSKFLKCPKTLFALHFRSVPSAVSAYPRLASLLLTFSVCGSCPAVCLCPFFFPL